MNATTDRPAQTDANKLPRHWKKVIRKITGLNFCDRSCGCGENSQLWWYPPGVAKRELPDWIPSWMNGVDTHEVWRWLVENDKASTEAE